MASHSDLRRPSQAGRPTSESPHPPLPRAFQLYVWRDRAFVREILARARAAGFEVRAFA